MRCGGRRPGTDVSFVDSTSGERFLQVATAENGDILIAYTIYDSNGQLVADSEGPRNLPDGIEVRDEADELLLQIPQDENEHIQYRLYSKTGALLTCSDGARTQLFGGVRLESAKAAPSAFKKASASRLTSSVAAVPAQTATNSH